MDIEGTSNKRPYPYVTNRPRKVGDAVMAGKHLKQPDGDGKTRTCLKCGKDFVSTGPANRICKPCTSSNRKYLAMKPATVERLSRKGPDNIHK